ncbi:thioredoxin domain-containing protein [bacterium]|nr:thioredoxin domain-containing protein [bacterium]
MEDIQITENKENISIRRKIFIGLLVFVGFITTIKLAIIYYNANFLENAPSSFCSINEFIDCDSVAKTVDSQFLGIPLALWGMFLYLFMALMMFANKLKNIKLLKFFEVFKNPYSYISSLGVISFLISIILLCVSLFQIKKLCILCAFTYVLNLLIGLFSIDYKNKGIIGVFKDSFVDFACALKEKKYLISFVLVVISAGAFLTYTSISCILAPHVKSIKSIRKFVDLNDKKKENPYAIEGNVLGDVNGEVKLHVYSDFRCPICCVYNIIIHKVISELDNVLVVHHNYPLDMECNKYLQRPFHQASCILSRYAEAAAMQGNYWGVASDFYIHQPMTDYDVWMIALKHGLDMDKLKHDVMTASSMQKVLKDIDEGAKLGMQGTPAIRINDAPLKVGVMPDYELKEMLIKAGAKEK